MRKRTQRRFDFRNTKPEELLETLTEAYRMEVEARGGVLLDTDKETHDHIRRVAQWMFFPLPTNLALLGKIGNGKTTMLRAITDVLDYDMIQTGRYQGKSCVKFVTARQVADAMRKEDKMEYYAMVNAPILAIDDLGIEPAEILIYGNPMNPMQELIYDRYENQLCTMITSNLDSKDFSKRYGKRVADRMNEQYEVIAYNNESYRKKTTIATTTE